LGKERHSDYRYGAILSVIVVFLMLIALSAVAQEKKPVENPDIHVTADKLVSDRNAQYAEFSGRVIATREDAKLTCNNLKIFYSEKSSGDIMAESGAVKKMVAVGGVRLVFEDKVAVAEKAVYTAADDSIVLTGGEPKVTGGSSYISGEKITLYRTAGKIMVGSGGSQRVEALFHPADKALTGKSGQKTD